MFNKINGVLYYWLAMEKKVKGGREFIATCCASPTVRQIAMAEDGT